MMHAEIKGSKWGVCIGGFRDVRVSNVNELLGQIREAASPATFQLFDANKVAGWRHLFFAAVNAVKAFETGAAFSKNLAIEILLYASCQDQISSAFDILGVSESARRVALLVTAENRNIAEDAFNRASKLLGFPDDATLEVTEAKFESLKQTYSISDPELESLGMAKEDALTYLVIEKSSLLAIHR